ncbi:alpha/beta hydrolase [Fragilaria crotonensis]|nr:alpha/beta hydrolase [Fragilaria crotonensis]
MTTTTPESTTFTIRDIDLAVHVWKQDDPKAVVVIYHGFLAHGRYPTVKYAAQLLHSQGFHVVAADMPGHGNSPGIRGLLPSPDTLIEDGLKIACHAHEQFPSKKLFLMGASMGGTIALRVGMELKEVSGVILLAPMLAINVGSPLRMLLKGLSYVLPTYEAIPRTSMSPEKQYRDEAKRKECVEDELSIPGTTLRVASANTCVEMAIEVQEHFSTIKVPFLCMVADEDFVVDSSASITMFEQAQSTDKTIKHYDALHGLLCEPKPLIDVIEKDLLDWIIARSN